MRFSNLNFIFTGLCLLVFASCLTQVGEENPDPDLHPCLGDPLIRLNDRAANDSHNIAVVSGFKMFASPKTNYRLRVKAGVDENSRLFLARVLSYGTVGYPKYISPEKDEEGYFNFEIKSRADTTELVWGIIRDNKNGPIFSKAEDVLLEAAAANSADKIILDFYIYGNIPRTIDSLGNFSFVRDSLFQPISNFFSSGNWGLTAELGKIDSMVIQGNSTVQINRPPNFLSLFPQANKKHVNIVLVNEITDSSTAEFLGFAPLNGFSQNVANFLVIKVGVVENIHQTILHEMGHHFGLRHNRATTRDILIDRDFSNIDDGFSGTPACNNLAQNENFMKPESVSKANRVCYLRKLPANAPQICGDDNLMFFASNPHAPNLNITSDQLSYYKAQINLLGAIH